MEGWHIQEKLYERVIELYDSQLLSYQTWLDDDSTNNIKMYMEMGDISNIAVYTIVDKHTIATYTHFPINIPKNKREQVSEYLTMANFGLEIGNFEMDFGDGEVRYKVFTVWEENLLPSLDVLNEYILVGASMLERYSVPLMKLLYADITPRQAIELVEGMV